MGRKRQHWRRIRGRKEIGPVKREASFVLRKKFKSREVAELLRSGIQETIPGRPTEGS